MRARDHFLVKDDLAVIHPVDPAPREWMLVELGSGEIDQMVSHRRHYRVHVAKIRMESGRVDFNAPRGALPTGVLVAATM